MFILYFTRHTYLLIAACKIHLLFAALLTVKAWEKKKERMRERLQVSSTQNAYRHIKGTRFSIPNTLIYGWNQNMQQAGLLHTSISEIDYIYVVIVSFGYCWLEYYKKNILLFKPESECKLLWAVWFLKCVLWVKFQYNWWIGSIQTGKISPIWFSLSSDLSQNKMCNLFIIHAT